MNAFVSEVKRLRENLDKLGERDRSFADSLLNSLDTGRGLSEKQVPWITKLADRAIGATTNAPTTQSIGDVSRIVTMLEFAKQHLKYPSITMAEEQYALRVSIAGEQAKVPGAITVTSTQKDGDDGRRSWFGRITRAGEFQPSNKLKAENVTALAGMLVRFAADPAYAAAEYGRMHGHCCFCSLPLSDERSTAVGYGRTCAEHFGLAWGADKVDLQGAATATRWRKPRKGAAAAPTADDMAGVKATLARRRADAAVLRVITGGRR